jgi:HPt (histidine-containing phosphotransfer) domain-containing protein
MEDVPAAVDRDVLDDLEHAVGDDRAFLRDVIDSFLDEAPRTVATIREGIATGNVESTSRAAHTLKSNAATLGALGLSAMARELETLTSVATTEASDLAEPEISALVDVIAHELDKVRDELDALVPPGADNS